ncbi:MAG: LytTR family DNA-binding domain-containing protein [Bryobacterales bacterium]|nr:LytTR family DNA-binding domain-containing protein [Bryobacterales bacterium]
MASTLLRTLIVDDEPVARRVLAEELAEIGGTEVVGEADNGEAAIRCIEQLSPDLVLLDIQMPVQNGFEVVRSIAGPLPTIIFVTAYSEHALRAFEVGAVDYLLKPINTERLGTAVARAGEARRSPRDSAERVAKTLNAENASRAQRLPKIVARRGHGYHLLGLDEVYAFQADGEIVWILTDRAKYVATQSLQAIDDRLAGSQFQRVHRGTLVNTDKIRKMAVLSSHRWLLTLTNGLEFTVSKRQAPLIRDLIR